MAQDQGVLQNYTFSATPSSRRPFIVPGKYVFSVQAVRSGRGDKDGLPYVAFDLKVEASAATEGNPPNQVGEEVTWLQYLQGKCALVTPQNLANFLGAATGLPGPLNDTVLKQVAGTEEEGGGPLAQHGVRVGCLAFSGTAKSGTVITKTAWSRVPGKSLSEILGGGAA